MRGEPMLVPLDIDKLMASSELGAIAKLPPAA
jgi:hypothetical protein